MATCRQLLAAHHQQEAETYKVAADAGEQKVNSVQSWVGVWNICRCGVPQCADSLELELNSHEPCRFRENFKSAS